MLLALGVLVSPLSSFLLWLAPVLKKGSIGEVIMLCFAFTLFIVVMIIWQGKMNRRLSLREDYPVLRILVRFHVCNLLFGVIGGFWNISYITLPFAAIHILLILYVFRRGLRFRQT
jgi:hypothetical protein